MGTQLRWHVKDETTTREETWVEGVHHARVEDLREDYRDDGRLIFKLRLRIVGPDRYKGQSVFEDYFIGSKDDPGAHEDTTWARSVGWKLFKELAHSFDFEPSTDFEELVAQMKGKEFLPYIEPETFFSKKENKQKTKGRVKGYYKLGSRPIGTTNGKATETVAPTAQPAKPTLIFDEAE